MTPKILITGASGLLGREVMSVAKKRQFDTTGLAFSRVEKGLVKCDLKAEGEVEQLIEKMKPNVIVHCAAERFPDKVEKDYAEALKMNVNVSGRLATAAKKNSCEIIYISTNYVFDGDSPPYKAEDATRPKNKYGETKLAGEKEVSAKYSESCILRIPVLYGNVEYLAESAITTLFTDVIDTKKSKSINHSLFRYPSSTNDIAQIICDLIELKLTKGQSIAGVYQWCGKERLTKYDMVLRIAEAFKLDHSHLKADTELPANNIRPVNCQMDTSKLEILGISHHTPILEGMKKYLADWYEIYKPID